MKKLSLIFLALTALTLTACKDEPDGPKAPELPQPKEGYVIVDGKEYAVDNVRLDVLSLNDNGFWFTITTENNYILNLQVATNHNGKTVDLSRLDPNAEDPGAWKYYIQFDNIPLAYGTKIQNYKLCQEGSYLKVKKVNDREFDIEFSLVNTKGVAAAFKYNGVFIPDMENPYEPQIYYDGTLYDMNSYKYDTPTRLVIKASSGLELTIAFDEANNNKQIALDGPDPVTGQAGKQPYVITVKPAGGSATTIVNGSATSLGSYAVHGSYLWVNNISGKKYSARANIVTDNHQLAFYFPPTEFAQL